MRRTRRAGHRLRFARLAVCLVTLSVGSALGASCTEWRRASGEDCLKDQDCLSGVCSQLHCASAPPLLDGETTIVPPALDAMGDAPTEGAAAESGPLEAAVDVAPPQDAPGDVTSGDVAADSPMEGAPDASSDASSDRGATPEPAPDAPIEASAPDATLDARAEAGGEADSASDAPGDSPADVSTGG